MSLINAIEDLLHIHAGQKKQSNPAPTTNSVPLYLASQNQAPLTVQPVQRQGMMIQGGKPDMSPIQGPNTLNTIGWQAPHYLSPTAFQSQLESEVPSGNPALARQRLGLDNWQQRWGR